MEQELKYIYTVYRQKSFSRAAEALHITQPALSIAVQKAESRLGMPVFDRSTKPLTLTPAGELLIHKIEKIRNLETELSQQLADLSGLKSGTLRVGGSNFFNSYVLPPVLAEFAEKYPGVRLELTEAGSDTLLQMIYDHSIDLTLNCTEHPKDSFRRVPCFVDQVLLAVPEAFPVNDSLKEYAFRAEDIAEKKHQNFDAPSIDLASFKETPFVLLTEGNDLYQRCRRWFQEEQMEPCVRLRVSQLATSWHLACAGVGAAFISDHLVSEHSRGAVFYKLKYRHTTRVFDLTMSDRHYVSAAMKAFQEIMQEHYGLSVPERKTQR